jgi:hypothetical protein
MHHRLDLRPSHSSHPNETIRFTLSRTSSSASREIVVNSFARSMTLRRRYDASWLGATHDHAVTRYLRAVDWITDGRLSDMLGADGSSESRRRRRLDACASRLTGRAEATLDVTTE